MNDINECIRMLKFKDQIKEEDLDGMKGESVAAAFAVLVIKAMLLKQFLVDFEGDIMPSKLSKWSTSLLPSLNKVRAEKASGGPILGRVGDVCFSNRMSEKLTSRVDLPSQTSGEHANA
ncbi:hypothetical protein AXG93_4877s1200 [Marchantia polymorpha subsp. ruderalis]|uniref:Uncharacterized protein n=1 Tax=Marchantia polymorpha subsp. ruderalis TaxID=1480154 RepID=A0A176WEK3_MARPO|nr:hypothetical protein AXG93_4877s1200 [Marchantia polymorpha subsp. ruderalis]